MNNSQEKYKNNCPYTFNQNNYFVTMLFVQNFQRIKKNFCQKHKIFTNKKNNVILILKLFML